MGRVMSYLLERRSKGRLHFTLIDPDKASPREAAEIASEAVKAGSDAILVGGSLGVLEHETDEIVRSVKPIGLPVILFPGGLTNASRSADAVMFMTVLNSDDPYFNGIAQVQGAILALKLGLETLPTAYILVGHGGSAGFIARARIIPYDKPELVAAHALAGAMMGSKAIYLEAGSGAPRPVPPEAVAASRKLLDMAGYHGEVLLIVGGGVRNARQAAELAAAGADVLVTGTLAEEDPEQLPSVIKAFKEGS